MRYKHTCKDRVKGSIDILLLLRHKEDIMAPVVIQEVQVKVLGHNENEVLMELC